MRPPPDWVGVTTQSRGGLILLLFAFAPRREIERVNNVPLTASKASLSEGGFWTPVVHNLFAHSITLSLPAFPLALLHKKGYNTSVTGAEKADPQGLRIPVPGGNGLW